MGVGVWAWIAIYLVPSEWHLSAQTDESALSGVI